MNDASKPARGVRVCVAPPTPNKCSIAARRFYRLWVDEGSSPRRTPMVRRLPIKRFCVQCHPLSKARNPPRLMAHPFTGPSSVSRRERQPSAVPAEAAPRLGHRRRKERAGLVEGMVARGSIPRAWLSASVQPRWPIIDGHDRPALDCQQGSGAGVDGHRIRRRSSRPHSSLS